MLDNFITFISVRIKEVEHEASCAFSRLVVDLMYECASDDDSGTTLSEPPIQLVIPAVAVPRRISPAGF